MNHKEYEVGLVLIRSGGQFKEATLGISSSSDGRGIEGSSPRSSTTVGSSRTHVRHMRGTRVKVRHCVGNSLPNHEQKTNDDQSAMVSFISTDPAAPGSRTQPALYRIDPRLQFPVTTQYFQSIHIDKLFPVLGHSFPW
jgi:hypothetical protein